MCRIAFHGDWKDFPGEMMSEKLNMKAICLKFTSKVFKIVTKMICVCVHSVPCIIFTFLMESNAISTMDLLHHSAISK